jgi:hypothetical protein
MADRPLAAMTAISMGLRQESPRAQVLRLVERSTVRAFLTGIRNRVSAASTLSVSLARHDLKGAMPATRSAQDPRDQFARGQFARSQTDYLAGSQRYRNRAVVVGRCDKTAGLHRQSVSRMTPDGQMGEASRYWLSSGLSVGISNRECLNLPGIPSGQCHD